MEKNLYKIVNNKKFLLKKTPTYFHRECYLKVVNQFLADLVKNCTKKVTGQFEKFGFERNGIKVSCDIRALSVWHHADVKKLLKMFYLYNDYI